MATRLVHVHHDYNKVGIVKDALMNPLTTAAITSLASTLGAGHKGLMVYDNELLLLKIWNGTSFVTPPVTQSGLTPKGNKAFNDTEPASPVVGDLYVFTSAGTNTWEGSTVVQIGDQVYWDGAAWSFIQGNTIAGTESIAGVVELATQAETNTGTDDVTVVTPLKLATYVAGTRKLAKTYFNASVTTVADTPLTINHALALQNRDAYLLSFKVSNSEVAVDTDSIDINNCSITTNVALTGSIIVIGY